METEAKLSYQFGTEFIDTEARKRSFARGIRNWCSTSSIPVESTQPVTQCKDAQYFKDWLFDERYPELAEYIVQTDSDIYPRGQESAVEDNLDYRNSNGNQRDKYNRT